LKDRDAALLSTRTENEQLQQGIRALKEELAERDGQLRVARMNLETAQKQNQHQLSEVARYEETIASLHSSLEKAQSQHTKTHDQLVEAQQVVHDLRTQLTTLQANNKETLSQLADQTKTLASIKTDLEHSQIQGRAMAEEVPYPMFLDLFHLVVFVQIAQYEDKMRKVKAELRKMQDLNTQSNDEVRLSLFYDSIFMIVFLFNSCRPTNTASRKYRSSWIVPVTVINIRSKKLRVKRKSWLCCGLRCRLYRRNLRPVPMRFDISSLPWLYIAIWLPQGEQMRSELEQLRHKQHVASEEIAGLRIALEESRTNGERLHRESELVVQNVNTWVREQKQANEKLGNKIRYNSNSLQ
jgi:hypothetical protein